MHHRQQSIVNHQSDQYSIAVAETSRCLSSNNCVPFALQCNQCECGVNTPCGLRSLAVGGAPTAQLCTKQGRGAIFGRRTQPNALNQLHGMSDCLIIHCAGANNPQIACEITSAKSQLTPVRCTKLHCAAFQASIIAWSAATWSRFFCGARIMLAAQQAQAAFDQHRCGPGFCRGKAAGGSYSTGSCRQPAVWAERQQRLRATTYWRSNPARTDISSRGGDLFPYHNALIHYLATLT